MTRKKFYPMFTSQSNAGQVILFKSCPPTVTWKSGMIEPSISANSVFFIPINKIENMAIPHMPLTIFGLGMVHVTSTHSLFVRTSNISPK